mgnify:CR=1 FL=1
MLRVPAFDDDGKCSKCQMTTRIPPPDVLRGDPEMVERLIDFGVEKAAVLKCLRYVNPSSKLTPKSAREFYDAVAEDEP